MKRVFLFVGLVIILASCEAVLPPAMLEDGSVVRYCNDPLLAEGEPCITDDRATLLGVVIGAVVFLSSSTLVLVQYANRKQNKRGR